MTRVVASVILLISVLAALSAVPAIAGESSSDVLVEVNGEPITSADLERMIIESHRGGSMTVEDADGLVPELLGKAIRDKLILQDAYAMRLDEESIVAIPVRRSVVDRAIAIYVRENIEVEPVSDQAVQDFFVDYYHKIQVRQLSMSTPEECLDALQRIKAGDVTMGEIAVKSSLDSKKFRGGLHNDKYWADVENVIRRASEGVEVGDYSAVFPYNDAFAFIRVESRTPANENDRPGFEAYIRGVLGAEEYERARGELFAECRAKVEITTSPEAIDAIRADEDILYFGEFKSGSDDPVLWIDEDHHLTDQEFREAMSHTAMSMGTSGFAEVLESTLEEQQDYLALWYAATGDGLFERPELIALHDEELRKMLIGYYLDEHVASKIALDREEYERFYEEHQDDFRGPGEVRLSIMTSSDEAGMRDAAQRLAAGADFDYVRAEVEGRDAVAVVSPTWAPVTSFNEGIREELSGLEVGQSSGVLSYGEKWMIMRLDGRREGQVAPIEEVDVAIRKALYYREFRERVDEHVARLEENAEIVRYDDRIRAWAERES